MDAYIYANFVRNCVNDVRSHIKVSPVFTYTCVTPRAEVENSTEWMLGLAPVICHPDDAGKDYLEDFENYVREI